LFAGSPPHYSTHSCARSRHFTADTAVGLTIEQRLLLLLLLLLLQLLQPTR
jgi:hypothetical protein